MRYQGDPIVIRQRIGDNAPYPLERSLAITAADPPILAQVLMPAGDNLFAQTYRLDQRRENADRELAGG